jgi:pyruvate dehydrogenase E2 component (dihydrolipoyllysine-residue acetyltransferase)
MSLIHALTMPKWGLSMKEGKIVGWLVEDGGEVNPGTEVVEIETEKILSSLEAPASGILRRKVARVDDVVAVAGLLGVIADISVSDAEIDDFIAEFQAGAVAREAQLEVSGPLPEIVVLQDQPLRYLKRGKGQEAAILIHGFGGDLSNWLFNHEELAERRTVYALDLPGHGGSSKHVGSGTFEEFAAILELFMDAVGLSKAHLVGHSMGGAVALEFALTHPERCLSLVLIASVGLGLEIDSEYINGFIAASRRKDLKPHLEKLFADSKLVGRQLVEDVLKFKRLDGVETALQTIASRLCLGGQQAVVLRDRLSQLSIPLLVIWGAEDRILPVSHSQGLPTNVRTEVLAGSGHMVHMEAAARVNRLIQSFWRSE